MHSSFLENTKILGSNYLYNNTNTPSNKNIKVKAPTVLIFFLMKRWCHRRLKNVVQIKEEERKEEERKKEGE